MFDQHGVIGHIFSRCGGGPRPTVGVVWTAMMMDEYYIPLIADY